MNTLRAEEPLLSYYQLEHDPFTARVPDFKFFPAQRKTILGQLHHLARHSQLILLVTGPKGSGKTLLRQALIASINKETVKVISLSAIDCPKAHDVLQLLANELMLEEVSVVSVVEQLKLLFTKGISIYLMIDDADQLSEDVIQLLLNLSDEQLTGLHLFLFARVSLLDKLEHSVIGKEVTFNLPLTPYTLEEAKEYLAIRLEGAGQDLSLFTETQIMDIYAQSGGWPGVINQMARDCLIENMQPQPLSADPELDDDYMPRKPMKVPTMPKLPLSNKQLAIVGVVVVCLVVVLLFSNKTPDAEPTTTVTTIDSPVIPAVPNMQTTQDTPLPSAIPADESETHPVASQTDSTTTSAIPLSEQAVTQPVATTIAPKDETKAPEEASVATPIKTTNTKGEDAVSTTKPKTVASHTLVNTKSGNTWYRARHSTSFTIQVSVASNEQAAKAFISKQGNNFHYFKRSRSGKVDYVVTYGEFSKRSDAQEGIKKLPTAIQQSKPWVRTFASIKQELAN